MPRSIYTASYVLIALHFARAILRKYFSKPSSKWPPPSSLSCSVAPVKPLDGKTGLYYALKDIYKGNPWDDTKFRYGVLPAIDPSIIANSKQCLAKFKPACNMNELSEQDIKIYRDIYADASYALIPRTVKE